MGLLFKRRIISVLLGHTLVSARTVLHRNAPTGIRVSSPRPTILNSSVVIDKTILTKNHASSGQTPLAKRRWRSNKPPTPLKYGIQDKFATNKKYTNGFLGKKGF